MFLPSSKRSKYSASDYSSSEGVHARLREVETELLQYLSEVEEIESGSVRPNDTGRLTFLRGLILACKDLQTSLHYQLNHIVGKMGPSIPLQLKFLGRMYDGLPDLNDVLHGKIDYIYLPAQLLASSGISSAGDIRLYVRDACRKQLAFIRDEVIQAGKLGFILGQPGTGKSVTCFYFASCLIQMGWTVTWIHVSRDEHPIDNDCFVVRMTGDSKMGVIVEYTDIIRNFSDLNNITGPNHLLVIDGIAGESRFRAISCESRKWLKEDSASRRLLYVSSMGWSGTPDRHVDRDIKIGIFEQWSWTYDEYVASIQNPEFSRSVEGILDASASALSIENKLEAKFFLAGGCARYMFEWSSDDIRHDTDDILETIGDVRQLTKSYLGVRNSQIRNRLLALYPGKQRRINSKYAEIRIATMLGPNGVRTLARSFWLNGNPGIKGLCLESFFFACIGTGEVVLYDPRTDSNITWRSDIPVYPIDPLKPDRATWIKGSWLRPMNWRNPAFYAVSLMEEKRQRVVRLVQVTRRQRYQMDLQPCRAFLENLLNSKIFKPNRVEIYFVVPRSIVSEYRIGPILNADALEPFGWPVVAKSIKANIHVVGIDFEL